MALPSEVELIQEIEQLRAEFLLYEREAAGKERQLERQAADLREQLEHLRAELLGHEREAAGKERQLERYAADLRDTFKQERARSQELSRSYMATVRALSNAVEARDVDTGKHAERVAAYGMEIARALGVPISDAPEIEFGFLLHDIGKVAIPDAILYKPGPLTDAERALMAQHPVIGAEIVREIEFLGQAAQVVRSHHERWDGGGYPDGLAGEQIPLAARVFAVADVLDALTTDRPYRPASPLSVAREMIRSESGQHFDPQVVAAFNSIADETFQRIGMEVR
jgi:putative nucleotidyltransferase with HDIG domain